MWVFVFSSTYLLPEKTKQQKIIEIHIRHALIYSGSFLASKILDILTKFFIKFHVKKENIQIQLNSELVYSIKE